MSERAHQSSSPTYPLGAVVRMTGLGEHTIRAWERRYAAVTPQRTPGGTRRYSAGDVARLRLLRAAVDAGHRISDLAPHSNEELERLIGPPRSAHPTEGVPLDEIRAAIRRLDLEDLDHRLSLQFAALGPSAFALNVAFPLLHEVGERWERGQGSMAEEHLLSAVTRGILGVALRAAPGGQERPRILFTTPQGELHEFGALIAAITALGAGASITYLGPNLPVDEVVSAVHQVGARAVALGVVALDPAQTRNYLNAIRKNLPDEVELWLGGPPMERAFEGAEHLDLAEMERRIGRLLRTPV